jgi:hypothetical protein
MTDGGELLDLTVRTEMKEWALAIELDPNATPIPTFNPIGILPYAIGRAATVGSPFLTRAVSLAAPGVSAILHTHTALEALTSGLLPGDISPRAIVRSTD